MPNMIYQQIFSVIASFAVFSLVVHSKQHDAATVGLTSDDEYISACPDDKPDFQAGLCYKNCAQGYHAVGPVCWKGLKSYGRGAGTVPITVDNPNVHPGPFSHF
jgi:hypothetical protein